MKGFSHTFLYFSTKNRIKERIVEDGSSGAGTMPMLENNKIADPANTTNADRDLLYSLTKVT
jgi:hypothetical protein